MSSPPASAETSSTAAAPPHAAVAARRNFPLGVVNGMLVQFGMNIMHPQLVLSAFLYEITQSAFLTGLLATLTPLGILAPQLFISSLIEHRPTKKPYYIWASVYRTLSLIVLAVAVFFSAHADLQSLMIWMFFAGFLSFRVAQGMGVLPFFDIIGQTIPPTRVGAFFAYRSLLGGILVLASGWLIVQPILRTVPSPASYGLLIVLGSVIMIVGWAVFTFSHELPNHDPPTPRTTSQTLKTGWQQFRENSNFRLIILRGFLTRINVLAIAFYIPYSVERFGAERMAGVFLGMFTLGKLLSSWTWGRLSDRKGNRLCLLAAGWLFALSPLIALVASFLPEVISLPLPGLTRPLSLPLIVYAFAIFFFGLAFQGDVIAQNSFLLENAAPERRASYRAVFSTFLFPMTLLPAVTGVLLRRPDGTLDVLRCQILFGILVVSGLASMLMATRIREIRQL